ncbi:MAG: helix-hairpin-helix domain-containing protein [Candidatus Omnitrophota bacterium]
MRENKVVEINIYEKIILIILSAAMLTGAFLLSKKHFRPKTEVTVAGERIPVKQTLEEIAEQIKEKKKVNINSAVESELVNVPGIGNVLASRIVQYRKTNGMFIREQDLTRVKGVGEKKLAKMKEYIKL